MKRNFSILTLFSCLLISISTSLHATQTENNVLHILPAPGPVNIDGKADDWDLSGGLYACDEVERMRDKFAVWFFAMYDKENVYLLTKWKDPTPLNNDQSSKGGHGFGGDCLQVRFIIGYKTPEEKVSHWMGWRDRDKISVLEAQYDRNFRGLHLDNAVAQGAQQTFLVDADGGGYTQEIAIPWKLLTPDGQPLHPGDKLRMALEPNYSSGPPWGRVNFHDIFREGVVPDRVFTFRAYDQWGDAVLEKSGHIKTPPVRLSDERLFPVKLVDGWPVADWTGLIQKQEMPGFKKISFDTPADGDVSLNIKDASGKVVRQLLTETKYEKGAHEVKWDGLTTAHYKTPGEPVEPGVYTWEGITHPPFKLTFRGWADNGGNAPWENGPTTHWGGDHGVPDSVATDGNKIFLGWSEAEAGRGLLGCDLDGNVVWKVGSGLGTSSYHLATDGGILFSIGRSDFYPTREIIRMRTSDGVFDNWEGHPSAALDLSEIWADQPDKASMPETADGLEVKNGKLYLTFSSQTIWPTSINDWKAFVTQLTSDDPLDKRILSLIDQRTTTRLKDFVAGKLTQEQLFGGNPRFDAEAAKALTSLLSATELVPGTDKMAPAARAEANRKFLEAHFGSSITPLKTNFIAVCDAHSGKLIKTLPADHPQAIHAINDAQIAFVSDGSSIMTMDVGTGDAKSLVTDLHDVTNFTTDADGKIYVATAGADQQVKIFTPNGKPSGTIGRQGGRQLLGKWQPDGMYAPSALAVDNKNKRLWVTEADFYPKRVSSWNLTDGKLVSDFFGATHYGASGGAIDPLDPNIMVGVGCEWKLDPATGRSVCTGVYNRDYHGFAVFCPGANGRLYVAVNFEVMHGRSGIRIFERVGEGDYKLRAEWRPDYGAQTTVVWSDINGDGKEDPNEVTTLPYAVQLHGSNSWSMNMNPSDFTLFGGVMNAKWIPNAASAYLRIPPQAVKVTQTISGKVYRINPAGFTECGAPKWDLEKMQELPFAYNPSLEAGSFGMLPSKDNRLLVTCEGADYRCYDLAKGELLWSYPNPFFQVHGSHQAPPQIPGLTRGAFGMIGTFTTPKTGTVWVINGNCGEWYMLTEKGYYLGHLFTSDVTKISYPEKAVPGADMSNSPSGMGGEDFGGSLTQAPDGKVYIQSGKTSFWNLALTGIDDIDPISGGKIEIKPADIPLARAEQESQMQVSTGTKLVNVKQLTPNFTGNLNKDFAGVTPETFQKGADSIVRSATAWDDKNLYLAWDVADNTPWTNGATEPPQMYVSGDTVDFQFGADAKADPKRPEAGAGDFRISIGNFQGKPTAVLYRNVSDVKKPRAFHSGVIARYEMQYVDVIPDARIQVTLRPDKKGYNVEAAIPWSALGFVPEPGRKYRADLGVTYGNEAASRTRLRVYWSNQETGLVDDAVFELKMTPRNWGNFIF
jgi:hypothetical protein